MPRFKKRTDKRYQAKVKIGDDSEGKPVYKYVYAKSETELETAKGNAKLLAGAGNFADATVGEWLDEWLQVRKRDVTAKRITDRTYETYEDVVTVHLKPKLGGIKLQKLQPSHIRSMMAEKMQLSGSRQKYIYTVLNMALTMAANDRTILWNPCSPVKKPAESTRDYIVITQKQHDQLIAEAKKRGLHTMLMVAWDTGMRLGELMGLTWQCVDTKRLTLSVEQSVKRSRAQGIYLSPDLKSKYAYRVLPITKETALALAEHRKQQNEHRLLYGLRYQSQYDLVFPLLDGSPQAVANITGKFRDMLSDMKITGLRWHDLRHTYASTLAELDIHPKKMQILLGHSSAAFTMDRYTHKTDEMLDGVREKLENRNKPKKSLVVKK